MKRLYIQPDTEVVEMELEEIMQGTATTEGPGPIDNPDGNPTDPQYIE